MNQIGLQSHRNFSTRTYSRVKRRQSGTKGNDRKFARPQQTGFVD